MKSFLVRHIALPQDHGSWVFLFSPLLIGLFAAGQVRPATWILVAAALAAFLLRQPVTVLVKVRTGRRPETDLPPALFWTIVYGTILLGTAIALAWMGFAYVFWLALPALPVFGFHLFLVSLRAERRQAGVETLATGVLALAAPAALWVSSGKYDPLGWGLWLYAWAQAAASIVHAYMRLAQREAAMDQAPAGNLLEKRKRARRSKRNAGEIAFRKRALLFTSFNLGIVYALSIPGLSPKYLAVPYFVQWAETLWGLRFPAYGQTPVRIGIRQMIVSTLFTVLFIIAWRIG
jgi:hypothetical protein